MSGTGGRGRQATFGNRTLQTGTALCVVGALAANALCAAADEQAKSDPYEQYIRTSRDFKPVRQDKEWALKAFPNWVYMPWQNLGMDDETAALYRKIGWNGQTIDFRGGGVRALDWINRNHLRFYCDHTAGKHFLHIWDGGQNQPEIYGTGIRVVPVNQALKDKLQEIIKANVEAVKASPMRLGYVLDDEIAWGHFSKPCMWQVTDDPSAFPAWLKEIYGEGRVPPRAGWISYDDILPRLQGWKAKDFDASQLMDQWTFNDSYWNNFLGDLVEYANAIDPDTPCGYEGGQGSSPFGGYDVAKYMRKIQLIESYGAGSIIRSFNPRNALPVLSCPNLTDVDDAVWQCWFGLAHGSRGQIGWITKRPGDRTVEQVAPTFHEAGEKIGPLMSGAEWIHDGVAIYYNHASVQLGWILDAQAHGKTWRNRKGDGVGTQNMVRNAWEHMLTDDGLQYNYISYVDVIQKGIPKEYKALILPDVICLSDAEAQRIKEFCRAGGTVVADFMPGLWDQHGRGRPNGGALDDLFGVKHDPGMGAADVFQGGAIWAEVNQDDHYSYKSIEDFLGGNNCIKDPSGYNKAVRSMAVAKVNKYGSGTAVLMNLSPQWYNAYRGRPYAEAAAKRDVFTSHVKQAVGPRWVELAGAGDKESGYEITYWSKGPRTVLFLCSLPEIASGSGAGGNSVGLKADKIPVVLSFKQAIANARDERTGKDLGSGKQFKFDWKKSEAIVVSFTL